MEAIGGFAVFIMVLAVFAVIFIAQIGSRRSSAGSLGRRTIRKISHRASARPEFHHSDYRPRCLSPDAQRNSDGHIEPKSALPKTTLSCRWTASSTFRSPIRNLPATERPTFVMAITQLAQTSLRSVIVR